MHYADLVLPEIREALKDNPRELIDALEEFHIADIAEIYQRLEPEEGQIFVTSLPVDFLATIYDTLEHKARLHILSQLPSGRAAKLIEKMSPDERTDFLQELPDKVREALLATVDRHIVREIRALLHYPPDTAGGIMTTEFLKVPETFNIDDCLGHIRYYAAEQEMIYTLYIVDEDSGRLNGVISLRDILTCDGKKPVSEIMTTQIIHVKYDAAQSEVAQAISKYDLLAIPVTDDHGRLLGIVTVDDVLDVVKEEQSEDIQRISAMQPIEEPYFDTPFFSLVKKRASWLVTLFIGELFTGTALRHYESAIQGAIALVFFVPLIISSGGNSGSQSSTLVIRSLVMGELQDKKRIFSLIHREVFMGLSLGVILGSVGFIRALMWGNSLPVALTIALTLIIVVTIGTLVGTILPLFFKRLGFDPAVSSAPFIASLVDVLGIIAFFSIAQMILHIPKS